MFASGGYGWLFTCNAGETEENKGELGQGNSFKHVHSQTRYHFLFICNMQRNKSLDVSAISYMLEDVNKRHWE
jgi:hypothetical protein